MENIGLGTGKPKKITGKFHIIEMDEWDEEDINLVGQGFIEIAPDGTGSFQFCAVAGWHQLGGPVFHHGGCIRYCRILRTNPEHFRLSDPRD